MTHEIKKIFWAYEKARHSGQTAVLATVVALDGSSYRGPGVRMLILSGGEMIGAVSGGCVEKEIRRQSEYVFKSGASRMMTYDGRYRLGCEGILYILLEAFEPDENLIKAFWEVVETRSDFRIVSFYNRETTAGLMGSYAELLGERMAFKQQGEPSADNEVFEMDYSPCFKLMIIGAEHDAVQLCSYAALTGWEVSVVAGAMEEKTIEDFPGAREITAVNPEDFKPEGIDSETAVVLMTHSYVKDLAYMQALSASLPAYIGLLGPASRRERLLNDLIEQLADIEEDFLELIHGPAGLDIGAETPQEIAISIMAEILAVIRQTDPLRLREKSGAIHSR